MKKASNMSTNNSVLVPRIESRIQVIRGLRVKRNRDRFPSDFLFQLTPDEKSEVVANCDHLQSLKFSKALPFAFTEHGAIQAANVLHAVRELTTPPEPIKRPIGFLTHEDKKTPKASRLTKEKKLP